MVAGEPAELRDQMVREEGPGLILCIPFPRYSERTRHRLLSEPCSVTGSLNPSAECFLELLRCAESKRHLPMVTFWDNLSRDSLSQSAATTPFLPAN